MQILLQWTVDSGDDHQVAAENVTLNVPEEKLTHTHTHDTELSERMKGLPPSR